MRQDVRARTVFGQRLIRARRDEAGFTIIELVVALSVFALMAGSIALTIKSGLNLSRNNRNRSIAANLASQEMDAVRQAKFTTLPLGLVQSTQSVDGVGYTVKRESEWVAINASSGPCDAQGGNPQVLRVTVSVYWPNQGGVPPATSSTELTPPVGAYDPNSGHIAVKVLDRNAAPAAADPVTVTGPGVNRTITTSSDGCAFFDHLVANTYTVTLGAAGFVDRQGTPSPNQSVSVVVGAVASVAFDYDQAATLALTLTPSGGGTIPLTLPVSVGNNAFLPSGSKTFSGNGLVRSISNLFPFLSGYEVWAGDCADADPEGQKPLSGGAYWPGAQRAPALEATPGGTTTGTVTVPSFEVDVTKAGLPHGPDSVVAVHGSDNGCGSGETVALGLTGVNGKLQAALPYGTWTIQVTGHSPAGSWPTLVLDPNSGSAPTVTAQVL
jgi:prepilin-type N-terminal cleavage/methylation domain-containing protein